MSAGERPALAHAAAVLRGDAMREGATPAEADAVVHNALVRPVADLITRARMEGVQAAQRVIAGEDTVEWARRAVGSSLSLPLAIEVLDDLMEFYSEELSEADA